MPDASSAEPLVRVPAGTRAAMVLLGWIPIAHLVAVGGVAAVALRQADWRIALLAPAILYLLPPLAVRATLGLAPIPHGRIALESVDFLRWWATAQWQIVFARLPWLEEALRLVPGLYSAWLRLWGARVGSLVYWSPGLVVLDRPFVRIGARVAFGAGVRLNPHVIVPDAGGQGALYVAPIAIGDDAFVGGYSLLLPGSEVAPREVTAPLRAVHAFTRIERGRRITLPTAPRRPGVDADVP